MNKGQRTGYFDKVVIKELFSAEGLIIDGIDLDEEEYVANVLVEVNSVGIYLPTEIAGVLNKIKKMSTKLVEQGFIHDIKFGDLVKGSWMIFVHFLDEDEIEEWEKGAIKNKKM